MLQEFGKQHVELWQFQAAVGRLCHTCTARTHELLAGRNHRGPRCSLGDLFPFHTEPFLGQIDNRGGLYEDGDGG